MSKPLGIILLMALAATAVEAEEFYVGPRGNDAWSGRLAEPAEGGRDGPFATLARAVQAVRGKGGAVVWVRGGLYRLSEPVLLTADDSGQQATPTVYRAYRDEKPVFCGAIDMGPWRPHQGAILRADVAAHRLDGLTRLLPERVRGPGPQFSLFDRGQRQTLARWPNVPDDPRRQWAYVGWVTGRPQGADNATSFTFDHPRAAQWRNPSGAQVHIFAGNDWYDEYIGVRQLDPRQGTLELERPPTYALAPGRRFYVRNVPEELDSPGEWYYDAPGGKLLYWPAQTPADGDVKLSYAPGLLTVRGAAHLRFEGLTFQHARGDAITVQQASNVVLAGCTVRHCDGSAVVMTHCLDSGVQACDLYDLGLGGVVLEGGDRRQLTPGRLFATNNHIHHFGRLVQCYQPGVNAQGVGLRVDHNLIHDGPHSAIVLGGNDIAIEFNRIHTVCVETSDAGVIYTGRDWTYQGNAIRFNFIHDIGGWGLSSLSTGSARKNPPPGPDANGRVRYQTGHMVWGVYLDDLICDHTVEGNIFARIPCQAVHIGGGQRNRLENNIFSACGYNVLIGKRRTMDQQLRRLEAMDYRHDPYASRYPHLQRMIEADPLTASGNRIERNIFLGKDMPYGSGTRSLAPQWASIDRNVVWYTPSPMKVRYSLPGQEVVTAGWEDWQRLGFDRHSILADPKFTAPEQDDYTLGPDSPAPGVGFEPIPLEKIGLVRDAYRRELPAVRYTKVPQAPMVLEIQLPPRP